MIIRWKKGFCFLISSKNNLSIKLSHKVSYSVDIVMLDEMILATEDIINNRDNKGFGYLAKDIPKKLSNNVYNMMLTTAYYHLQDAARITEDLWKEACDLSDDEPWLREACSNHDRCYFTEGTSSKECNAQFYCGSCRFMYPCKQTRYTIV